ncbi:ADP-ribosylation factor-like protein [candidate division KSB1 bacterium]|nr:ADP-ribosylation factor-like protein [candidate division KSB1 bacterium]
MLIKELLGELHLKIVYFGPGMSGKTTNLQKIHARIGSNHCGDLTSIKTREDRTLFFDFMQLKMGKIGGLTPKFNLYTVPGQTYYQATRKLVLSGVDGIVFVADSQAGRMSENIDSFNDLNRFLNSMGKSMLKVPVILQCNKQDLATAIKPDMIQRKLPGQWQGCFSAIATKEIGVFESFKEIIVRVGKQARV